MIQKQENENLSQENMPEKRRYKGYDLIKDRISFNKAKCSRKRTIMEKCMHLSMVCNQKIVLAIYDHDIGKLHKFCSHDDFDWNDANAIVQNSEVKSGRNNQHSDKRAKGRVQLFSYGRRDFPKFCDADDFSKQ